MRIIQILLIAVFLIGSFSSYSKEKTRKIKVREVLKHNKSADCWMVYEKGVYDLTNYFSKHPAPPAVLERYCGKDGTKAFKNKGIGKDHTKKAYEMLETMKIGELQ